MALDITEPEAPDGFDVILRTYRACESTDRCNAEPQFRFAREFKVSRDWIIVAKRRR